MYSNEAIPAGVDVPTDFMRSSTRTWRTSELSSPALADTSMRVLYSIYSATMELPVQKPSETAFVGNGLTTGAKFFCLPASVHKAHRGVNVWVISYFLDQSKRKCLPVPSTRAQRTKTNLHPPSGIMSEGSART